MDQTACAGSALGGSAGGGTQLGGDGDSGLLLLLKSKAHRLQHLVDEHGFRNGTYKRTLLLMTIFGTPEIMYRCARRGNSCTSTTSALIWALSIAMAWATRAT